MSIQQIDQTELDGYRPPSQAFPKRVIALAAFAGGLQAITTVLAAPPARFPAAILVVQHLSPHYHSYMAEILTHRTLLAAKQAATGDYLKPSMVFVAPPGQHLLVNPNGSLLLTRTEKLHFVRPAADQLFKSVATSFRERAIAVVLTGFGLDGAQGVEVVKQHGGVAIAQDQATATQFGMPGAAIATGVVDYVLPLPAIADQLMYLCPGDCP